MRFVKMAKQNEVKTMLKDGSKSVLYISKKNIFKLICYNNAKKRASSKETIILYCKKELTFTTSRYCIIIGIHHYSGNELLYTRAMDMRKRIQGECKKKCY